MSSLPKFLFLIDMTVPAKKFYDIRPSSYTQRDRELDDVRKAAERSPARAVEKDSGVKAVG